jgi:hypothetical protein
MRAKTTHFLKLFNGLAIVKNSTIDPDLSHISPLQKSNLSNSDSFPACLTFRILRYSALLKAVKSCQFPPPAISKIPKFNH